MKYRKLTEIKKLAGNPRIIRDKQFKTLCQSIQDNPKYFEARPCILSNRTGELIIIAGNQRYEAAKFLKLKEVPTFLMEGLTEAKEKEIIIRDNIPNGEFDFSILANEWDNLPLVDWGVDLPKAWVEPWQEKESTISKNFNQGKGQDINEQKDLTPSKYPVTFILDQSEWEAWEAAKDKLKVKDDKTALLKIIGGKNA